ncbi:MAG TPA: amidohydrolase family protein [Rhizobium sp.]
MTQNRTRVFRNLELFDPETGRCQQGFDVLVENGRFARIAPGIEVSDDIPAHDLGGRVLMPGLIDCHVHVTAHDRMQSPIMASMLNMIVTNKIRRMLFRGFTTARDTAGADAGHRDAVAKGLIKGPRLFVCGRGLSQTGGHGDMRARIDQAAPCRCAHMIYQNGGGLGRICDGEAEVRRAARDEIRLGADFIKIFASGGVGSPADPIHFLQYSEAEIRAIVEETEHAGTYAAAHAYTAAAIYRAVDYGARTIEHGNFIDERTAALMAERGAFLVPTLVAYHKEVEFGDQLPPEILEKAKRVLDVGSKGLEIARKGGVKMAFGTDLMGDLEEFQNEEFAIRCEVLSAADVIRSATTVAADLLGMSGQIGVIREGALADAIVVDRNPADDISVLGDQGRRMSLIMKDGAIIRSQLAEVVTKRES